MTPDPNEGKTDLEMMSEPPCWPNFLDKDGKRMGLLPLKRRADLRTGVLMAQELEDGAWHYLFTPDAVLFEMPSEDQAVRTSMGLAGLLALLVDAGWVVD